MKQLNITFEDKEFEEIETGKKNSMLGWREYILKLNQLANQLHRAERRVNKNVQEKEKRSS